jgi:exopolysaccharide production protein ExoZ
MQILLTIQYLRGCAALAVVWIHSYLELEKVTGLTDLDPPTWFDGRSGVDLFFVISGFIIWTTTDADDRSRPMAFVRRRIIRIVPLYWICTLAMMVLLIGAPGLFGQPHFELWHLVQSLLFIPHYDPFQPGQTFPLLAVGWTLNFEMFFYASFCVALLLRPHYRAAAMVIWLGGLVATGAFLSTDNPQIATYTNPLLLEFMAGMLIGYACRRLRPPPLILGYGLILSSIISYVALNQGLDVIHIDWRTLCWGLPAALLVAGAIVVEQRVPVRRLAGPHLLGDASYAIYLSHVFALGAVGWIWSRLALETALPNAAFIAVALLLSAVGGVLLHLVIEKPFIRWLSSLNAGKHSPAHDYEWHRHPARAATRAFVAAPARLRLGDLRPAILQSRRPTTSGRYTAKGRKRRIEKAPAHTVTKWK